MPFPVPGPSSAMSRSCSCWAITSTALQRMLQDEPMWAYEVDGRSFDIGRPAEYAHTVAAFAGLIS